MRLGTKTDRRTTRRPEQDMKKGELTNMDRNQARAVHFERMQKTLEDGLKAINCAGSMAEADSARLRTQVKLEELNRIFEEAFPETK